MVTEVDYPALAGFSESGMQRARALIAQAVSEGALTGAVLQVSRGGKMLPTACFGRRTLAPGGAAVTADAIFLIASITKPIVCMAVMQQIEQGRLCLDDRVADVVPEFGNRGKEAVLVRHLLTHTSGLPDMLPDNQALRQRHEPLSRFVSGICELDLLFDPGTRISYQSCGIAMLGEIVARLSGLPVHEAVKAGLFDPLELSDTSLGRQDALRSRICEIKMPASSDAGSGGTDWDWNSDYWQHFGAPWGGLFTTASELTALCQTMLYQGERNGTRVLSRAAASVMASDQTSGLPDLPQSEKLRQRWGLGWRLRDGSLFGDLTSAATFGHGGATGTVAWIDPETEVTCVFLTNDPEGARWLRPRVSNAVAAAVV